MMRDNHQQIQDVQKMKQLKEVQEEVSLFLLLLKFVVLNDYIIQAYFGES